MDDGCSSNAVAERAAIDDGRSLRFSSLDDTPISSILSRGGGEFLHLPLLLSLRLPLPLLLLSRRPPSTASRPGRLTLLPATLPLLLLRAPARSPPLPPFFPSFFPPFFPSFFFPPPPPPPPVVRELAGVASGASFPRVVHAGQRRHTLRGMPGALNCFVTALRIMSASRHADRGVAGFESTERSMHCSSDFAVSARFAVTARRRHGNGDGADRLASSLRRRRHRRRSSSAEGERVGESFAPSMRRNSPRADSALAPAWSRPASSGRRRRSVRLGCRSKAAWKNGDLRRHRLLARNVSKATRYADVAASLASSPSSPAPAHSFENAEKIEARGGGWFGEALGVAAHRGTRRGANRRLERGRDGLRVDGRLAGRLGKVAGVAHVLSEHAADALGEGGGLGRPSGERRLHGAQERKRGAGSQGDARAACARRARGAPGRGT